MNWLRVLVSALAVLFAALPASAGTVAGELKQWHRVTVDFQGPESSERGLPNPFMDYRLQVEFTGPRGQVLSVPGYFAADGNAGETSAAAGRVWRAHLAPDQPGRWTYRASFRHGPRVAVADDPAAGAPAAFDGDTGAFLVAPTDKTGRDFRAKGALRYVGGRYLRFAGSGEYFLKAGTDSPETLLGYADFDGASKLGGGELKTWAPHVRDWRPGDPTWKGGKGKGLIGALNYLAGEGLNAVSFLTLNIVGDGKDVWMYAAPGDFTRFDVSKLDQWEVVFSHAQRLGLYLHFKTQEEEVDQLLDGGELGDLRKLYYRELVARFGHHLALNWNLGEENTQTTAQQKAAAGYFRRLDPYGHNLVIHTFPPEQAKVYEPLLGSASALTGASVQTSPWKDVHRDVLRWVSASAAAGKPWVVASDEVGPHREGVAADADYTGARGRVPDNRDSIRQQVLWGAIIAGGAGVEYYFGYDTGETDITLQDFRSRDRKWDDARLALEFFTRTATPFWDMRPADGLASSGWVLAQPGQRYVVYLPSAAEPATLDLTAAPGRYRVQWYDPRTGSLTAGAPVAGGRTGVALGRPPSDPAADWAVLVERQPAGRARPAP